MVDLLLANPVLTARFVARQLGMTPQGAVNLLRQLEGVGVLRGDVPGQGMLGRWWADEVLGILEP